MGPPGPRDSGAAGLRASPSPGLLGVEVGAPSPPPPPACWPPRAGPAPLSSGRVAFRRPSGCSRPKARGSAKASAGHFRHLLEDRSPKKLQDLAGSFLVSSRKGCRVFCGDRKPSSRAPPFYFTRFGVRLSHQRRTPACEEAASEPPSGAPWPLTSPPALRSPWSSEMRGPNGWRRPAIARPGRPSSSLSYRSPQVPGGLLERSKEN